MIKIIFKEPTDDPDWVKWRAKCAEETENLKKAFKRGEEIKIKDHLYKDSKVKRKYYFNDDADPPFHRKCCYCEAFIEQGDIEHYRPKKGVADFTGSVKDHPGYFWLAYDWRNLFPSCNKCNRLYNWQKKDGKKVSGKKNLFPLQSGSQRAFEPKDDLSGEDPLIINPFEDNPDEHLKMEFSTGSMCWHSEKGEATVKIFGMNIRDKIRDGRKKTITATKSLLNNLNEAFEEDNNERILMFLEKLSMTINGKKEYTFASRCFLKRVIGDDYEDWINSRIEKYSLLLKN